MKTPHASSSLDLPALESILLAIARSDIPRLSQEPKAVAAQLSTPLAQLGRGLTRERRLVRERYLDDPLIMAAYLLYYLPANALRIERVLAEIHRIGVFPQEDCIRILDLGCGSGAGLVAFTRFLDKTVASSLANAIHYRGIDRSAKGLDCLRAFWTKLRETHPEYRRHEVDVRRIGDIRRVILRPTEITAFRPHIVLASYVFNELFEDRDVSAFADAIHKIMQAMPEESLLIIIEPGLEQCADRLSRVRERLREEGWAVYSPCTHEETCPLVTRTGGQKQWCHQEVRWKRTPLQQALDGRAGFRRRSLAFSHLVIGHRGLRRPPDPYPPGKTRCVRALSPALKAKGRLSSYVCGEEGLSELILQHRDRSRLNESFKAIRRGDKIVLEPAGDMGAKTLIGPDRTIQVIGFDEE